MDGAAVTKELGFITEPEDGVWDFSSADFTDNDITDRNYLGLQLLSGMQRNKNIYCLGGSSGELRIPVKTACAITVEFCYGAAGTLGDVAFSTSSGSSGSSGDMIPTTASGNKSTSTVTNPDGSVTTTETDKAGNTTVTTVAPDGSKVETVTNKAGDKTITVSAAKGETQIAIQLPASIPAPEDKFTDVPEGHWAEKSINDMAGLGMVKGVNEEAHIFDMDSPMTRGSIATILFRFSNGAAGKPNSFTDVSSGTWYADASTLDAFVDSSTTSSWAVDGMAWCVSKGIVTGKLGSVLDPSAAVSRAEAAVMFDRMIGLIK